jgi:hypothetical protein
VKQGDRSPGQVDATFVLERQVEQASTSWAPLTQVVADIGQALDFKPRHAEVRIAVRREAAISLPVK